nr:hypothetical protein [Campylobacter mucosalis]
MISAFFDEHELKDKADTLNVKFSTDIVCYGKGGTPYGGEKLYLYGTKNSQGGLDVLYWEPQYPLIRQSWSYTSEYDYPDFKTLEQTAKYDEARYAKFLLGKAYYEGKLVAKDDNKALEWAKKAYREDLSADRNFFAATLLGLLYAQNKDFKQAKFFLEQTRGYFNGHPKLEEIVGLEEFYGKAMYELGIIYYEGKGIAKNPDVAMIIFKTIMQTEEFGMRYEPAKELF